MILRVRDDKLRTIGKLSLNEKVNKRSTVHFIFRHVQIT